MQFAPLIIGVLVALTGWSAVRLARRTSVPGAALAAALLTLAIWVGLVQFTFPPQALLLLQREADPVETLLGLNLWGPRFALSYPAVLLRDQFGWSLNVAYTRYAGALLLLWSLLGARIVMRALAPWSALGPLTRLALVPVVALQVAVVASAMNGRLVPALVGMAFILDTQLSSLADGRRRIVRLAFGVFLTMMSSGTMMVGLTQTLIVSAIVALRTSEHRGRAIAAIAIFTLVVTSIFTPIVAEGIAKNLAFYDGSIVKMLSHGAGQLFFLPDPVVMVLALLVATSLAVLFVRWASEALRTSPSLEPLLIALPLSVALGLFGYSTMLMFLPAFIALATLAGITMASPLRSRHRASAPYDEPVPTNLTPP